MLSKSIYRSYRKRDKFIHIKCILRQTDLFFIMSINLTQKVKCAKKQASNPEFDDTQRHDNNLDYPNEIN